MKLVKWTAGLTLAVGMFVVLAGCDKLTRNHYEMIQQNVSSMDDVERTIGKPDYRLDGQWHYDRVDRHLNVVVDFSEQGVVVRKQWIDTRKEVWEDTEMPGETDTHEKTTIRKIDD